MKQGKTLTELAVELERQAGAKRDFIVPTEKVEFKTKEVTEGQYRGCIDLGEQGGYEMTDLCNEQLAAKLDIPLKYYKRMLADSPALLTTNVNHWLHTEPSKNMVRTLDGRARAWLSNKYRPLDYYDYAEAVLPALTKAGCEVVSCEITDRHMYLKAVAYKIEKHLAKVNDTVCAGIALGTSEVGCGALWWSPFSLTLSCTNGATHDKYAGRKVHIGRGQGGGDLDTVQDWFSDETRTLDDRAFWGKVSDTVAHFFNQESFERIVESMLAAADRKIEADPVRAVEVVQKRFALNDAEKNGVLKHLLGGNSLSQYGLMQAVTRTSQDVSDYERATELEKLGGDIIELPKRDWEAIAQAN